MIQFPIPEPYRSHLILAGQKACEFHHPRVFNPKTNEFTFVATLEYREAHEAVERAIAEIPHTA